MRRVHLEATYQGRRLFVFTLVSTQWKVRHVDFEKEDHCEDPCNDWHE